MFHFEKAADQCLINKRKSFMDSKGYGYEEMCNHFSNYYRKENTEGRWSLVTNTNSSWRPLVMTLLGILGEVGGKRAFVALKICIEFQL